MNKELPIDKRVEELMKEFKVYIPEDPTLKEMVIQDYRLMYSQGQVDILEEE